MMVITKLIIIMVMFILVCITTNDFLLVSGEPAGNGTDHQVIIRCKDNEREALLTLKQGLTNINMSIYSSTNLSSWGIVKDCCDWEDSESLDDWHGVYCNYATGHVIGLSLYLLRGEISPSLLELSHLNYLDLSSNDFGGNKIPEFIGSLDKLVRLDLSNSNFSGDVPYQLGNLTNLRSLYLSNNSLTSKDLSWLSNLTLLSDLYLSHNQFEGTISDVHFTKLHDLTHLDLSFNSLALNFSSHWIPPFHLVEIRLANCTMGPRFPSWLQTQTDFQSVDLSLTGISDEVPSWFWNHSAIVGPYFYLNLSGNSLSGLVPADTLKVHAIDISFNNFSGPLPQFSSNSFIVDLSHNMFSGTIQSICRTEYFDLRSLDLSYNQLSGDLPNCFENMTYLYVLNLAENRFHGHLPPSLGSLFQLQTLILRNNKFTGELPSNLSGCQALELIDCGGNALTGHVPTWMGSLTNLVFLILSQNSFYGNIPLEICRLSQIQVLDLSHNNISGRIPQCFQNFTSLVQTNGSTDHASVKLGLLSSNIFLSSNTERTVFVDNAIVRWKRQESEYRNILRLLKLIDLSSNNLVGNIPLEISRLAGLASLNLSQNHFTGNIFSELGQMKMLESLDLSGNNLSGEIPASLAELNFLSLLDLSNNNLSGKIPQGGQLHSFDVSSYAGNKELCGQPLPNCPGDSPPPRPSSANRGNQGAIEDQKEGFNLIQSLIEEYFISAILGFIVGFWIIIGPLVVKRTWRNAYFGFWSMIGDWFYLMVTLSWRRLIRYMKSRN